MESEGECPHETLNMLGQKQSQVGREDGELGWRVTS